MNLKCSLINREMAGESRGWERSGGDGNRFNFHMSSHDSGQKQITNIRRCKKKLLILFDVSEVQTVNMILGENGSC